MITYMTTRAAIDAAYQSTLAAYGRNKPATDLALDTLIAYTYGIKERPAYEYAAELVALGTALHDDQLAALWQGIGEQIIQEYRS